jgi:predicted HTH domain antitoxin
MKSITVNIPDTIELDSNEALMMIASGLYEKGRLSLGQSAELAGLSKRAFMEILGSYGVSIFNHPVSDLDRDVEHAKNYCL